MPPGFNHTTKEAAAAIAATKLASDPKTAQLDQYVVDMAGGDAAIHTMYGVKVDNTDSWIKAGPRGPMTLDDQHGELFELGRTAILFTCLCYFGTISSDQDVKRFMRTFSFEVSNGYPRIKLTFFVTQF